MGNGKFNIISSNTMLIPKSLSWWVNENLILYCLALPLTYGLEIHRKPNKWKPILLTKKITLQEFEHMTTCSNTIFKIKGLLNLLYISSPEVNESINKELYKNYRVLRLFYQSNYLSRFHPSTSWLMKQLNFKYRKTHKIPHELKDCYNQSFKLYNCCNKTQFNYINPTKFKNYNIDYSKESRFFYSVCLYLDFIK